MQNTGTNVQNRSEVSLLCQQIAAEYESAQRAMDSFAYGSSKHQFITKRLERMGELHTDLRELVGEVLAEDLVAEAIEDA